MGRINKTLDGAFIDIVGNNRVVSEYDQFLNKGLKKKDSGDLKEFTGIYNDLIKKNKPLFEKLALLEEIIMQMRIKENLTNIKLSQVREYIYARTPFYRKDKKGKDVRIIVDKIDFYPEATQGLEILFGNPEFMNKAKTKLAATMQEEILKNITSYFK